MTIRQELQKAIDGGMERREAIASVVKLLKVKPDNVRRMYVKITSGDCRVASVDAPAAPAVGLTSEELLLKHSPEHKIAAAAESLAKGRFIPESSFIAPLKLSGGYKHIVEQPRFEKYRGRAQGGIWYWSHPDSIAEMKRDQVLA